MEDLILTKGSIIDMRMITGMLYAPMPPDKMKITLCVPGTLLGVIVYCTKDVGTSLVGGWMKSRAGSSKQCFVKTGEDGTVELLWVDEE